jgi:SAM-dependent methyltransferase
MPTPATGFHHYQQLGDGYAMRRRPDPRIEARLWHAIGDARTVLNVGAGTGSYEPPGANVVALEPSTVMLRQRKNGNPCLRGVAGSLPFPNGSFDVAMGVLTIHHWPDWRAGLLEMQRVARRVVLLTHDTDAAASFWLLDYFPSFLERDRQRMPPTHGIQEILGGSVETVPVPFDCTDGFLGAYWRTPARYLDAEVRQSMSCFGLLLDDELEAGLMRLETDLLSGEWDRRYAHLVALDSLDLGYRLIVS